MKNSLLIIGSGDHAHVIYNEAKSQKKFKLLGFIDKNQTITKTKSKIKIYKSITEIKNKKNLFFIIGVGNNKKRKQIYNSLKNKKYINWATIVSKNANLSKNINIGIGAFIAKGVQLCNNVEIGMHCIINTSSSIDHDNKFNDFSSTGPGVITGGNVTVGSGSHIGIGTIVKNNIHISNEICIGGNSYVNKNCIKSQSLYFGTPIKFIKKITKNFNFLK